ncbi:S-(hydroxymethyl)glutathione dehydrogenase [Dickeya zeae]|uniref:S-(Hydroxymethyl)glutathione dehydrogenase n=1 Tax=Dickeya zeae TaxID=204042 RepID=A0ABX8VT01_9GAMM|nr:S-(hydroxymethyl)glutathione dehydrogenase [Dickeya zeae]QYM91003.1 S-(hydroxymethyl)glutathione dehydrogenase [Dickeya zeae]
MSSFNLVQFKKALEEELNIIKWEPTENELKEIFNEVLKLNNNDEIFEVEKIVSRIYKKNIVRISVSGLNTSKASSLLAKIQSQTNSNQQKR